MSKVPDPKIPFGKYKDKYASDIDDIHYLDWLIGQDWFCEKFKKIKDDLVKHLKNRPEWINL